MALIRWQNILFALLPGLDALGAARAEPARRGSRARFATRSPAAPLFLACAVVAFLPQMLAWHSIYGSLIARSPVGPQIRWTDPHLVDILWSARNGLFSTAPILYLGAIGLARLRHRPARGRRADARRSRRDGLFQRLHPGLVGQRGIRRTAVRRADSALRRRTGGVHRCHRGRRAPSRGGGRHGPARGDRGLECRPHGRGAERRGADRRDAALRSRLGVAGRVSSTAGSAIPSPIPPASSSPCATASRLGTTTCSRPTASSPIRCSRTGAWTSEPRRPTAGRMTTGCSARDGTRRRRTARSLTGGRRRPPRCGFRSTTPRRSACRCGSTLSRIRARRRRR